MLLCICSTFCTNLSFMVMSEIRPGNQNVCCYNLYLLPDLLLSLHFEETADVENVSTAIYTGLTT